ncbi:alpha-L-rhamnosidase [Actinophytocola oryzae]|uniref:alpha-L-rhamnosidase n=1 Tax=Actinophytocola oryzae TaxID=502181 RepID=A0A4R7V6L5_9PSEU|nr:alpha-L-rhamnosidase [Actinophytocola oryzae]TDV43675.1 alpha-L-rhamnosidase [Actinophytocola oryzae]
MGEGVSRRVFLQRSAVGAGALAIPGGAPGTAGHPEVVRTTVEYADRLLGTDVVAPRLSWVVGGGGERQSAYQVRVDGLWDSGKVVSSRTFGIPYGGPALAPHTRYQWRVRVWDERGRVSPWSSGGWWETGFLDSAWQARWIGAAPVAEPPGFEGASWVWAPGGTPSGAPPGTCWFRCTATLRAGRVTAATLVVTADDDFTLYVGGEQVLHAPEQVDGWKVARFAEVTARVEGGSVTFAVVATNRGSGGVNPGGLLVRLLVEFDDGSRREVVTDGDWRVSDVEQAGWQLPGFDDGAWARVAVLAAYGGGPWGSQVSVLVERPAPVLRREFSVDRPVASARLYIAGLAYYDAVVNGRRVGTQVLDPGFTDYDDTVLYATHDVTRLLSRGVNDIQVTLGRGFFGLTSPNVWNWHRTPWHGEPRLLAQLVISHPDGSRTVVGSGAGWEVSDSATVFDSVYAGETYDARWTPTWVAAAEMDAPRGRVRAQQHEPIEVAETVTPTGVTALAGGFVVDMGRTMAGWVRLTVTAPAGTRVRLQYGERLASDGSVRGDNQHVPGRHQLDEYVCAGAGRETWEPRFSYKGFRYVQVTGLAEPPVLEGRVVHSAVPDTSEFRCSEPFFERLERAMRRTVRNNLHGIPTDTPMYEKNGWTGDAQLGTPVMVYALGMQRFFTKWLGDVADSQNAAGQLPVIVPSGGWGYQQLAPSPEWTTVYPFVLREMYRVYGDDRVVAEHWPVLVRYLDWELARLRDGLAVTALGDWLPPGYEDGIPPEDTRLTATAYLHRGLSAAAELGDLLGHTDVAGRYRVAADGLRDALNAAFLREGVYRTDRDPGYRQTSNAVPLAFGLVPGDATGTVVEGLVADIRARGNHLNTGALGTSVLLPVLTAYGHADLAHAVATQRTCPGWGYWFDNGADTMWEMWPLDSRSRDHYFFGTVVQWLYENVAGLRPGDAGYGRFTVRPDARVGVTRAATSVETVRGRASVDWVIAGSSIVVTVEVPFGATAEVHVPVLGTPHAPVGARLMGTEAGYTVYEVGRGRWRFGG